jgi:hypothetical protein
MEIFEIQYDYKSRRNDETVYFGLTSPREIMFFYVCCYQPGSR